MHSEAFEGSSEGSIVNHVTLGQTSERDSEGERKRGRLGPGCCGKVAMCPARSLSAGPTKVGHLGLRQAEIKGIKVKHTPNLHHTPSPRVTFTPGCIHFSKCVSLFENKITKNLHKCHPHSSPRGGYPFGHLKNLLLQVFQGYI